MPRRSIGGYLTLAGVAAATLYLWRRPNPKQKLNPADHRHQPSQRHEPARTFPPTPQEGWHPEEKKHRGWERGYWLATLLLTFIIAIGAGLSARYAYQAASESRRQADIAQKSLNESDRPLIYIHVDQSGHGAEGDASIEISNLGTKPAIIVGGIFFNNDSGIPDYDRSLKRCFIYVKEILIAGQRITPDCNFNGASSNNIRHLYGYIRYKSVTGTEWLQTIDYFFNSGVGEWYKGGGREQNSETRLDAQGNMVEEN